MERLLRTVLCFACLLSAYWLYALLVVPQMEPTVSAASQNQGFENATYRAVQRIDLTRIFPPGAWELDGAKVLETDSGVLVFKEWTPAEDGQMTIHPVTLLLFTDQDRPRADEPISDGEQEGDAAAVNETPDGEEAGGEGGGEEGEQDEPSRPIILRAPEGAVLYMDGATNPNQAEFGTPTGGRLLGRVTITRAATPGKEDRLQVATRNVQIDPQRVWTPHDVEFRYGRSYGQGRDLEIALKVDETGGDEDAYDSKLGSVQSLKLVHLDELVLELPPREPKTRGGAEEAGRNSKDSDPTSQLKQGPVRVTAAGPFRFDFQQYRATFEERVRVARLVERVEDVLTCELLSVDFRQPDDASGESEEEPESGLEGAELSAETADSDVVRLVAERNVRLDSPSTLTSAECDELRFEVLEGRLTMRGDRPVSMKHDKFQIEAGHLEYILNPTDPKRLGELWASGPGSFQATVGSKMPKRFTARWQEMLRLQPQNPNHVISLYGKAFVAYQDVGQFASDDLHLYVWEVAEPVAEGEDSPDYRIVPDRMLARGGVRFDSPQIVGQTEEVNVWFRSSDTSASPGNASSAGSPASDAPDPGADPATSPLPRGPLERAAQAAGDPRNTPRERVRVEGQLVQLLVALDDESKARIEDLTISGDVTVRQPADPAMPPRLILAGATVQMSDVGTPQARGRVVGSPARVIAEGNDIQTRDIEVFQGANELHVKTPGSMTLPLAQPELDQAAGRPGRVTVSWKGGMSFDGLQARFFGGITLNGTAELKKQGEFAEFQGSSNELVVTMTRRIDFEKPPKSLEKRVQPVRTMRPPESSLPNPLASDPDAVEVDRLELIGDVKLFNRSFGPGPQGTPQQRSYDQMESPHVTFHQVTQRIEAAGPGRALTICPDGFLKGQGLPGTGPARTANAPPARPPGAAPSGKLIYVRVAFENGLEGNLAQRQIRFFDRVDTVYGPVAGWSESVEPDQRGSLGDQDVELHCAQMQITEMRRSGNAWIEFEAAGNTRVEGRRFSARARRITYDQSKDLLILHGDSRTPATLEAQQRAGEKPKRLQAEKIHYSPRTRNASLQGLRTLDLGPANSNRSSGR